MPLLVCALGCRRASDNSYVPTSTAARTSLVVALDAWAAGETASQLDGQSPVVQVADSQRRKGQRLAAYEIVAELPIDGGRRFEVELRLSDPSEPQRGQVVERAQYVVLGIDPIWVIRQEDFNMITHWDHPMHERQPPPLAPKLETYQAVKGEPNE